MDELDDYLQGKELNLKIWRYLKKDGREQSQGGDFTSKVLDYDVIKYLLNLG